MSLSDDGKTMYMAEASQQAGAYDGLTVLDVSQVQNRTLNPSVPVISKTTWPNVGTPQTTEPFTVNGHPYLMETDEYGSGSKVGAGRIIDIADIKKPVVISNMRLQVNQEKNQADPEQAKDPGASEDFQGYEGHYCTIPTRVNPTIVACSFIVSGFRLFDITDVTKPQEIAYFNGKVPPAAAKRVTAAPATKPVAKPPTRSGSTTPTPAPGTLPTTGLPVLLPVLALVSLGGFAAVRRRGAAAS
ncbi:MAG: hypothetical protein LC779_04190 [Actinobacteria bacterium]|nr:hypothetical protein [Actinomycetota bacterium]